MTKVLTKLLPLASFNQIDTRRYKTRARCALFQYRMHPQSDSIRFNGQTTASTISQQNVITIMYFVSGFVIATAKPTLDQIVYF